jgi:transposase
MDFLQHLLPSQTALSLISWQMDSANHQITFNLSSNQSVALCPLCHAPSHRSHSRYERTLKDLPFVLLGDSGDSRVARSGCRV